MSATLLKLHFALSDWQCICKSVRGNKVCVRLLYQSRRLTTLDCPYYTAAAQETGGTGGALSGLSGPLLDLLGSLQIGITNINQKTNQNTNIKDIHEQKNHIKVSHGGLLRERERERGERRTE